MISWSLKPRRVFAVFLLLNTLWHDIFEVKLLVVKVFEIMTYNDRSERVFIMLLVFVCPSKPPSGYCVGQAANQSLGPWRSCWCLCGYAHLWYGCLNHVCQYLSRQNLGDSNLSSSKPLRIYAFQMCQIQGRGTHFWLISAISLNRTAWNHSVLGNRSWMSHLSWLLQSWRAWRILAPPIMADLGSRSTSNHQFLLNRCWHVAVTISICHHDSYDPIDMPQKLASYTSPAGYIYVDGFCCWSTSQFWWWPMVTQPKLVIIRLFWWSNRVRPLSSDE